MRNLIKSMMCVVMFMFTGIKSFGAAIVDGLNCAACNQHMCMIHTSHHVTKHFAQNPKPGQTDSAQEKVNPPVPPANHQDRKPEPLPPEIVKKFDVNNDGKLDKQERLALLKDRIEKNERLKKRVLEKFDADKNGVLSDKELESVIESRFDQQTDGPRPPRKHDPAQRPDVSPSEPPVHKEEPKTEPTK